MEVALGQVPTERVLGPSLVRRNRSSEAGFLTLRGLGLTEGPPDLLPDVPETPVPGRGT